MKIIKKNGRIEEFDIEKMKGSLINAANEIGEPLSESDLKLIEKEATAKLNLLKREITSSYEVFAIVLYVLKEMSFNKVGKAYFAGSIEF